MRELPTGGTQACISILWLQRTPAGRLQTGKRPLGKGCAGFCALFSQLLCEFEFASVSLTWISSFSDVLILIQHIGTELMIISHSCHSSHQRECVIFVTASRLAPLCTSHLALWHFTRPYLLSGSPLCSRTLAVVVPWLRASFYPPFHTVLSFLDHPSCSRQAWLLGLEPSLTCLSARSVLTTQCLLSSDHSSPSQRSFLTTLSVENNHDHFLCCYLLWLSEITAPSERWLSHSPSLKFCKDSPSVLPVHSSTSRA